MQNPSAHQDSQTQKGFVTLKATLAVTNLCLTISKLSRFLSAAHCISVKIPDHGLNDFVSRLGLVYRCCSERHEGHSEWPDAIVLQLALQVQKAGKQRH